MELNDKELEEYNRLNSSTKTTDEKMKKGLEDSMSWIIITLLAAMQVVISCLGTVNGHIEFIWPQEPMDWVWLVAPKLVTSILAYMIWMTFLDKGKQDAQETKQYKEAEKIFNELQSKTTTNIVNVENPSVWERNTKIKKGIKVAISSFATMFLICSLAVNFNIASLIATLTSLLMSAVWGVNTMVQSKRKWSIDYLRYATLIKIQQEAKTSKEITNDRDKQQDLSQYSGTSPEE